MNRTTAAVRAGWLWLAVAGAVIVIYRAATQSFTIDESFVFQLFLDRKPAELFSKYDAAYHVLHTWATWLSMHFLGKKEFVIRLPSVIAGLAYLAAAGMICRKLLGDGWQFFCGAVLLSANPLVADYLSISRGYGAALAFFAWGFYALLGSRTVRAGLLFGLSVASNLTFLFPVAAMGTVYVVIQLVDRKPLISTIARLALPFAAVAVPIVAIPLTHANMGNYFFGAEEFHFSLITLLASSLAYPAVERYRWIDTIAYPALLPIFLLFLLMAVFAARKREWSVVLAVGSIALSVLYLFAAHYAFHVLYPWTRTGLYLIWLFMLACVAIWGFTIRDRGFAHWMSIPFALGSMALAVAFLAEFDTHFYYDFRSDAEVRPMMRRLREIHSAGPACLGGTWLYEPTVNYYRLRDRIDWLEPMVRTETPQAGCPYFFLSPEDARFVGSLHLRPLWTGPVSGAILAEAIH